MKYFLVLMTLGPVAQASAGYDAGSVGTAGGVFLKMPAGARGAAMGEAQAAAVEGAAAASWNPAALSRVGSRSALLQHGEHVAQTSYDYAAFAQRAGSATVLALDVRHFSAGRIAELDATGTEVGSFSPRDLAVAVAASRSLECGLSLGLAGRHISSKIIATAETQTMDAGVLYSPTRWPRLALGFSAANLLGSLRYERVEEDLPRALRAGGAWRGKAWTAAADAVFPEDNAPYAALGMEWRAGVAGPWRAALRAGLNTRPMGDVDGFAGPSFGLGLGRGAVEADYAFVPLGGVGMSHVLSLSFDF